MAFHRGPKIVTNGLVLALDAANTKSYVSGSTTWRDLSGNGNSGSLVNGPTFSSANASYINYDGTDDYADLGNIFNFTTQDFTFSHWFYCNSLNTNRVDQGPVIFYKGAFNANGYYSQIAQNGVVAFITNNSGAYQATTTSSNIISAGVWYNITYTRSSSSVKIYVNGVDSTLTAATHINPGSSSDNFRIANYQNGYIYANIRIASFQTYNRTLSASEVAQNYNAQKSRFNL